ncbi:hypothetical protein JCM33374_g2321 [Metschnikowia sp. JCM 33374]|nr:hypothetical protein JCM33374_g2321 [Metschnikowia sp. JCM 33374]
MFSTTSLNSLEETIKINEAELERVQEEAKSKAGAEKNEVQTRTDSKGYEASEEVKENEVSAAKMTPVAANITALHDVRVQEMIARGAKHFSRKFGSSVPSLLLRQFVSPFHNCWLGGENMASPAAHVDEQYKSLFTEKQLVFVKLDSNSVATSIANEVCIRFRHSLGDGWLRSVKPLQLLRQIAMKVGTRWKAQKYAFPKEQLNQLEKELSATTKGKKSKPKALARVTAATPRAVSFVPEDIVSLAAIAKDFYRCSFVDEVFETARMQIQEGENWLLSTNRSMEMCSYNSLAKALQRFEQDKKRVREDQRNHHQTGKFVSQRN